VPPIGQLTALLGLSRISFARIAAGVALLIVATVLTIAACIELIAALRFYLRESLDPAAASVLTGLFILALAAVIGLIASHLTRTRRPSKRRARRHDDETAAALSWVLRHPQQAALIAAVLGFCTGAMPEARDALREMIKDPD